MHILSHVRNLRIKAKKHTFVVGGKSYLYILKYHFDIYIFRDIFGSISKHLDYFETYLLFFIRK